MVGSESAIEKNQGKKRKGEFRKEKKNQKKERSEKRKRRGKGGKGAEKKTGGLSDRESNPGLPRDRRGFANYTIGDFLS